MCMQWLASCGCSSSVQKGLRRVERDSLKPHYYRLGEHKNVAGCATLSAGRRCKKQKSNQDCEGKGCFFHSFEIQNFVIGNQRFH